jgi:hypothetical protein
MPSKKCFSDIFGHFQAFLGPLKIVISHEQCLNKKSRIIWGCSELIRLIQASGTLKLHKCLSFYALKSARTLPEYFLNVI